MVVWYVPVHAIHPIRLGRIVRRRRGRGGEHRVEWELHVAGVRLRRRTHWARAHRSKVMTLFRVVLEDVRRVCDAAHFRICAVPSERRGRW